MSKNDPRTHIAGRDARDGKFVKVSETYARPNTTTRERVPNPGRGDTGPKKK